MVNQIINYWKYLIRMHIGPTPLFYKYLLFVMNNCFEAASHCERVWG